MSEVSRAFAVCVAAVLPVAVVSFLLHELGHAALAALSGFQVFNVYVGLGPPVLAREWRGARFVVQQIPLTGATTMGIPPTVRWPRLGYVMYVAGGPLANALVALLALLPLVRLDRHTAFWPFLLLLTVVNGFLATVNLLPVKRRRVLAGQAHGTDGYLLLRALRGGVDIVDARSVYHRIHAARLVSSRATLEALVHADALCALSPETGQYVRGFCLLALAPRSKRYRCCAVTPTSTPPRRYATRRRKTFAMAIVQIDDPWLLAEGDACSSELSLARPAAQLARGGVLVRTDRIDEGVALLKAVHDGGGPLRLPAAHLLAEAALRGGRLDEAEAWIAKRYPARLHVDFTLAALLVRMGHNREVMARMRDYTQPPWAPDVSDSAHALLAWATLGLAKGEYPPSPPGWRKLTFIRASSRSRRRTRS